MTATAVPIKPAALDQDSLVNWLVTQGLEGAPSADVFAGFCDRLGAMMSMLRGYCGMRVIHPHYTGFGHVWRRGEGVVEETYEQSTSESDAWMRSPLRLMVEEGNPEIRLDPTDPAVCEAFPILDDLRQQGATDYHGRIYRYAVFGDENRTFGVAFTLTTDKSGGFSDADIALLAHALPVLALTMRVSINQLIGRSIARAYLGHDAADRVLAGAVQRGHVETISAVLLYGDLSGFTALGEALPTETVVAMLNDYLTCMAEPVEARGGQVLKFMGDGMLSTFRIAPEHVTDNGCSVCIDALDAAIEALQRIAALNEGRRDAGLPTMPLNIALHRGEVLYGNVGSTNRLDFTMIGPAVNQASRIEGMCGPLERNLLISDAFADVMPKHTVELLPLGKHGLRSVREPVSLYTVADLPEL